VISDLHYQHLLAKTVVLCQEQLKGKSVARTGVDVVGILSQQEHLERKQRRQIPGSQK
jgi:hypothetical protein